jgi:hypothetical protein
MIKKGDWVILLPCKGVDSEEWGPSQGDEEQLWNKRVKVEYILSSDREIEVITFIHPVTKGVDEWPLEYCKKATYIEIECGVENI